jgi:hypothetical protein
MNLQNFETEKERERERERKKEMFFTKVSVLALGVTKTTGGSKG